MEQFTTPMAFSIFSHCCHLIRTVADLFESDPESSRRTDPRLHDTSNDLSVNDLWRSVTCSLSLHLFSLYFFGGW